LVINYWLFEYINQQPTTNNQQPIKMTFFEFYNIPIAFKLDESALKKTFYAYSKKYHPDFHTLEDEDKQDEILELSTLNTEAYKTLSDFDKRMKYILDLKGTMAAEGENKLPQDFLMEMMDINEAIMELEFDFDERAYNKALKDVQALENQQLEEINPVLDNFDDATTPQSELEKVKNFYLKKRYLLRIRENLSKFAPL
jgi:molecular chaperone HscB